jgi:aminopeptidase N
MVGRVLSIVFLQVLLAVPSVAQRLPATVLPEHYDLAFDVDLARARFDGVETIRVRLTEPTRRIVLHALDITFHDVTVAGQNAAVATNTAAQTATLSVSRTIPRGVTDIRIRYSGILNDQLRGFYLSEANGRRYGVTQLESTDARRAFPCFDEPAFKATFGVTLTLDRDDTAISNGRLLSDTPGPGANRHTMKFAVTPRMSTYLVAMAVGEFRCLSDRAEGIPIRICATPDKAAMGTIALDWAKRLLAFYNDYFSIDYPFEKLDVVAVPDFAAGAMENTAAIFYRESSLLADSASASRQTQKTIAEILAHEIAHQWFGNLVTMRWWDDLWLNEGFATWMESRPLATLRPDWDVAVDEVEETRSAFALDSLRSTRAIHAEAETPDEIEALFDAIAYEKGASVLRMLEAYLGPDALRAGVNAYLEKFAYGNATTADFWTVLTRSSQKPVDRILRTFVNQPGVPLVEASVDCNEVTLTQRRFFFDPLLMRRSDSTRWEIPVCLKASNLEKPFCVLLSQRRQALMLPNPGCASWIALNAAARGYFRTGHPPAMLSALAPRVADELTPPERLAVVGDAWDLVRAGRHTVRDYLEFARAYGSERVSGVLAEVTEGLRFVHDYLTTGPTRDRFRQWVLALLKPHLARVSEPPPGGETEASLSLRAVLIEAGGGIARDPAIIAGARAALDRALAGGAALEPTTADAIVAVAARDGDARLFEALKQAALKAASPDERERYLFALGRFEDPAIVERGLQYALSPDVRAQDTAQYLARFLENPAAHTRAWEFVRQHWTDIEPKIAVSFGTVRLVGALDSFCTRQERDDILRFFDKQRIGPAAPAFEQTIERIRNCITIRETQTKVLDEYLGK